MSLIVGEGQVVWYPDQVLRPQTVAAEKRTREAANLIRRTVRLAVNQRGPQQRTPVGVMVTGRSLPGDAPFRESGRLYRAVGFDFQRRQATYELFAAVVVDSYGWETGRARGSPGVRRPHLRPVFEANRRLVMRILEGAGGVPQYGAIPRRRGRGMLAITGVSGRQRGRLTNRVRYVGQFSSGTYREVSPRAIRRPSKR
jgi:hypothetical protein